MLPHSKASKWMFAKAQGPGMELAKSQQGPGGGTGVSCLWSLEASSMCHLSILLVVHLPASFPIPLYSDLPQTARVPGYVNPVIACPGLQT